ncbi:Aste57867_17133 [Aphanomyces stellatus]|uniref:Aste57867_17133 protein n=1 Tax=Aphanomyces stellatus TaxID=120398 RepID=A0A485L757_9STRA|nr:hypothetical protein As57867_017074 [Aphanomyces stellatus]VFT93891.1 Aste57867_17133 [Aphanomyces stellatus]
MHQLYPPPSRAAPPETLVPPRVKYTDICFPSRPDMLFCVHVTTVPGGFPLHLELFSNSDGQDIEWHCHLKSLEDAKILSCPEPIKPQHVLSALTAWLSRSSKAATNAQVDVMQQEDGPIHLVLGMKCPTSCGVCAFGFELTPWRCAILTAMNSLMARLDVNEPPIVASFSAYPPFFMRYAVWKTDLNVMSKYFELVEGGIAVKFLKSGVFRVQLMMRLSGAAHFDLFVNALPQTSIFANGHNATWHGSNDRVVISKNSMLRVFGRSGDMASQISLLVEEVSSLHE